MACGGSSFQAWRRCDQCCCCTVDSNIVLCLDSQPNTSLSGRRLCDGMTNGSKENGDDDDEPPAGGRAKVKRRSA